MAKRIKNPIELRAIVREGIIDLAVVRYGVTCEHDIEERRELEVERNEEIQNCIKDFCEEGLRQAEIFEDIAEGDSLLS